MSMDKYEACLEGKKLNRSRVREEMYRIFVDNPNKLVSIPELFKQLENYYPKKISINTLYRNLSLLVTCNLVLVLQDDNKKSYYILVNKEVPVFSICPKCQVLSLIKVTKKEENILAQMIKVPNQKKTSFVVLHKLCLKCQ